MLKSITEFGENEPNVTNEDFLPNQLDDQIEEKQLSKQVIKKSLLKSNRTKKLIGVSVAVFLLSTIIGIRKVYFLFLFTKTFKMYIILDSK